MREIRSSGSVEGVMGNHDSYSDSSLPASALAAGRAAFCFDCYGTFSAPPSRLNQEGRRVDAGTREAERCMA